jgi:hypothetical protein
MRFFIRPLHSPIDALIIALATVMLTKGDWIAWGITIFAVGPVVSLLEALLNERVGK